MEGIIFPTYLYLTAIAQINAFLKRMKNMFDMLLEFHSFNVLILGTWHTIIFLQKTPSLKTWTLSNGGEQS